VLYDRRVSTGAYALGLLAERGYSAVLAPEHRARLEALKPEASRGRVSAEDYWDELLRLHGVVAPDERARLRARIFEQAHQIVPLPGARSTLVALKARGFLLGIVTDTMYPLEWKLGWLARVGVAELIDAVACSTVVGAHKPEPRMYRHALDLAGLEAGEAAFVGHDARELDGARRVGLATVAVNYEPGTRADYFLERLPDLLELPIFATLARSGA
jgi:HAD superfamily hydrolase (TIGR01509 family)